MRIAVIADIHGDFETLSSVTDAVEKENPDIVVCPGDFTDMFNIPKDFSQMDMANMVVHRLLAMKKRLLCVLGNHDPYEIVDVFNEFGINLHNDVKAVNGVSFLGCGGAETPFNTLFEPSDKEITEALHALKWAVSDVVVLVTHVPPHNTKVDLIKEGKHVGSPGVRKFIEDTQPTLAISSHIHESQGIDKIGKTTVFYPGPAYDGFYGIVEVKKNEAVCEIKCARPQARVKPSTQSTKGKQAK